MRTDCKHYVRRTGGAGDDEDGKKPHPAHPVHPEHPGHAATPATGDAPTGQALRVGAIAVLLPLGAVRKRGLRFIWSPSPAEAAGNEDQIDSEGPERPDGPESG